MKISWQRNFYILCIAEFFAIIGFQVVQPFLPYYIQEFEVGNLAQAGIWAGRLGTAGGLAMAVSSPLWGTLADRFGRKLMVVRSMLGGGLTVLLLAYASTLEQLLVVRLLHGALSGTVTACITMVSTTTPRPNLALALGMMQGTFMLGAFVGPLIGGAAIDQFGYRECFIGAGMLIVLSGICVQVWVKEDFSRPPTERAGQERDGFIQDTRRLLSIRPYFIVLISFTLIQFAFGIITPVTPLFLQQLARTEDITSLAGLVFSLVALAGALASVAMGKWSERLGLRTALMGGLAGTAFLYVGQGLAPNMTVLVVLMIANGLAMGGLRPVINLLVARLVPESDRGKAFGVLSSANALGWGAGPIIGGYLGAELGFRAVFFITALLFLLVAVWMCRAMQRVRLEEPEQELLRKVRKSVRSGPERRS